MLSKQFLARVGSCMVAQNHLGQYIILPSENKNHSKPTHKIKIRNYTTEGIHSVIQRMGNTDWNSILIGKSAEESYNHFFNERKHWFNVYIPERKKKAINNNKYPIFDSDEVKQIRNTLDAIATIFKVTRSNGAYIAYKKCKEILRQNRIR
ncbi:hypothetical protein HHI36_015718 [Cryptolaemus montrouzieri]|uniref:Uncharacterized protein n=1 Tax=Cryptolaemus montrouzieri TaxID=559131 RepID=A0ABD2N6J9_9CUCU